MSKQNVLRFEDNLLQKGQKSTGKGTQGETVGKARTSKYRVPQKPLITAKSTGLL